MHQKGLIITQVCISSSSVTKFEIKTLSIFTLIGISINISEDVQQKKEKLVKWLLLISWLQLGRALNFQLQHQESRKAYIIWGSIVEAEASGVDLLLLTCSKYSRKVEKGNREKKVSHQRETKLWRLAVLHRQRRTRR